MVNVVISCAVLSCFGQSRVCVDIYFFFFFFFFQAEDGIRDGHVTGVQTYALPISGSRPRDAYSSSIVALNRSAHVRRRSFSVAVTSPWSCENCRSSTAWRAIRSVFPTAELTREIGRASCRERVSTPVWGVTAKQRR